MLKEARIVMPYRHDSAVEHDNLRAALIQTFGGYTSTMGQGGWYDGQKLAIDKIWVYDVAIEAGRDASWDKLFQIAVTAGRELKQESVYIRYPDGHVDIASCAIKPAELAKTPVADIDDTRNLQMEAYGSAKPLGAKRLPQVGEVWRNGVNQLVAVVRPATILNGGYAVVSLTTGDSGRAGIGSGTAYVGTAYVVDLDGKVLPDKSSHPRDLKTYVTRFDS